MFLSTAVWATLAVLFGWSSAQSPELLDAFPKCALLCLAEIVPTSNCELDDTACICADKQLNLQVGGCVLQNCTSYEGLQTQNVTMTMCGAPVRDKSLEPLVIGMVFGGLALLAVVLRILSTISESSRSFGWDDAMIIITVIIAGPPTAFAITLTNNGLGKDIWTLELQQIKNVLLYYYLGEIFYFAAITCNKLSLLLFFLRIFPDRKFRILVYGSCGLVVAYGVSFIFATAFQCSPVEYSWQQIDDDWGNGTCNNIHLQGWLSAVFNIVIDLILLALPLKNLWGLHMALKRKLMIMFMFSLGIFVTIISAIRLTSLVRFANSTNITWDQSEAAWWSTLEIHIGIICACLPSVRNLFISLGAGILRTHGQSSKTYQSGHSSSSRSGNMLSGKGGDTAPKHGDERDFVPLVDYPHDKGLGKEQTYSVRVGKR